jgi:hypothetical protein
MQTVMYILTGTLLLMWGAVAVAVIWTVGVDPLVKRHNRPERVLIREVERFLRDDAPHAW